jgi:protein ImuB
VQNHRPHYQGQKLQLVLGPERIEAEWWSEDPVQRDYFVAQTSQQQMVWVYRTPGHHWFLHGFFG